MTKLRATAEIHPHLGTVYTAYIQYVEYVQYTLCSVHFIHCTTTNFMHMVAQQKDSVECLYKKKKNEQRWAGRILFMFHQ